MPTASFSRSLNISASTKRSPTISGGLRGDPATQIASLLMMALMPVDAELQARLHLDTPHELLQTFVDGDHDVQEGDVLVAAAVEYPVRAVEDWPYFGDTYRRLVVERLKK